MGKIIMSGIVPNLTKPVTGTPLSTYTEGSIIKINENSSPVEFYVAKHDYEAGLNGAGRTLVVRKDLYDTRAWGNAGNNAYSNSLIDKWLNGDYKSLFSTKMQISMGITKFQYTPMNGNTAVSVLERSLFLLSGVEMRGTLSWLNTEGSMLPIDVADKLKVAYLGGTATVWWLRSPVSTQNTNVAVVESNGSITSSGDSNKYGSRPCFTLSSAIKIDENGQVIE